MRVVGLLLFLTLGGCAGFTVRASGQEDALSRTMSSWVGSRGAELLATWGPASRIVDDGDAGRILVYNAEWCLSAGHHRPERRLDTSAFRLFFVDSGGTITAWRWQTLYLPEGATWGPTAPCVAEGPEDPRLAAVN